MSSIASLAKLGNVFLRRQATFILDCQEPNGGFRGKSGPADLYYSRFALRGLAMLRAAGAEIERSAIAAAAYFLRSCQAPDNIADMFCLLDSRQALCEMDRPDPLAEMLPSLATRFAALRRCSAACGGNGDSITSIYAAFLLYRCGDLLGIAYDLPALAGLLHERLRPDGGFADTAYGTCGQMAATAAAVMLGMRQWGSAASRMPLFAACADFVLSLQDDAGGFRAHALAMGPDLLSTLAAAEALHGLGKGEAFPIVATLKFVRAAGYPDGGFGGWPDDMPDVEHLCYALEILGRFVLPALALSFADEPKICL